MLKVLLCFGVCGMTKKWSESVFNMFIVFLVILVSSQVSSGVSSLFAELSNFSLSLIELSVWITILSAMASCGIKNKSLLSGVYLFMLSSLLVALILTFSVSDFIVFYLSFEVCLIPIMLMILGWGYQPERSSAGIYMLFYTLFGSLPLFFCLILMTKELGSGYVYMFSKVEVGNVLFVFLILAFLVKFPMYSVHIWLLKAHVEAPVAGSMILAGILLKLGGYGIMQVMSSFYTLDVFKNVIFSISVWGSVVVSLSCLRCTDMKLLIASSSVVHMSTCIVGLVLMSEWGVKGCLIMMIGHGLCSSGLFCVANFVYERSSSRSLLLNKGLLNLMPSMSVCWFLLIMGNMAGPPSVNLMGEILLLNSIISWSGVSIFYLVLLSFFSASYSLYLYSLSQHGESVKSKSGFSSGVVTEFLMMAGHIIPLNMLVLGGTSRCSLESKTHFLI